MCTKIYFYWLNKVHINFAMLHKKKKFMCTYAHVIFFRFYTLVIGLISNISIAVQNLYILGSLYIMGIESVVILETDWMDCYQADIRRSDNVIEVRVNDKKAKIGFQYQRTYNCE